MAKQLQGIAAQGKGNAPTQVTTKKTVEKSSSSSDEETPLSTALPPRPKMVLKQEPIPKKARRESELEELLADQERKNETDKVMLWRKLQAEIAKSDKIADE